jgi:selenocysteine-specific elongation factor
MAQQDVAAFMARHGFADAPIVPVSNKTGEGIGDVRDTLQRLVDQVRQRNCDGRAFRMNIERVFSVKGYGTVVTGIPISGEASVGEAIELLPRGTRLTIRAVQTFKRESERAMASCCAAINVRDLDAQQVMRGQTIAAPGVYRGAGQIVCAIESVLADAALPRRFTAMLHSGTAVTEASVKLLDRDRLACGQRALAEILLAEELVMAAGDRFILRLPSPSQTLGGGTVLPEARGHGIQRALIADRIRRAAAAGAHRAMATADVDSVSAANLEALGLRRIWIRGHYRFEPKAF